MANNKIYASTLSEIIGEGGITSEGGLFAGLKGEGALGGLVSSILTIAVPLAGISAVVLLTIAGYKMITSQGNPDKLNEAKEMITNAIIGLIFILLSISILTLISNIFELGVVTQ